MSISLRRWLRRLGGEPIPVQEFHADHYLQHNARRLEHLASLQLSVAGRTVLEVGAGIGDHSSYYLDRGCRVTITEGRAENLAILRQRYPAALIRHIDLDQPQAVDGMPFDIVHCYGLLYHLKDPIRALHFLADACRSLLLLETCVSFGQHASIHPVAEAGDHPTQAVSGTGCRPTRPWVWQQLRDLFPHVYVPRTQPNHPEFPIDWTRPADHQAHLSRAVFVASRQPIGNPQLTSALLDRQVRHA